MKKEKTIRTYQRRTKTGKVVTVKQHTAKYDAVEALKEAAKKKGAGDELESLKEKPQTKPSKEVAPKDDALGFTADEYKAWYHWDQDADPKNKSALKVEKALKAKMGAKGYKKYFDEVTDSYSSRGHNKAFKGLGESLGSSEAKPTKEKVATKTKVREDLPSMKHGGDVEKDAYSHKVATSKLQKEGFKLGKDNLYHHTDGRVAKIDQKTGKWVVISSRETKAKNKKSPQEREAAFKEKHAAKVEEWKKNGNVRQLKKEIASIKLQYGSDRKKAESLIRPLEEAISKETKPTQKGSEKPSKKVSPVTKVGKEAMAAEKNQRPVKVRQLPKANASLSRMTGTLHFDVSGKNPATVSRDEKDRSKWNVSLGVAKKTFGSQKEVFAYLRKVKKANAQRAERASSYKNADANISMD